MITTISKTSAETVDIVAGFTFANKTFQSEVFPGCRDKAGVAEALKRSGDRWTVLVEDKPLALFSLEVTSSDARIDRFLPENAEVIGSICSSLRNHFLGLKVETVMANVSDEFADSLTRAGFTKASMTARFTRRVGETRLMPILPLSNPTIKDIPALAKLMRESYAKSDESRFEDLSSADKVLRGILRGARGPFLTDASFISNASDKIVSACLTSAPGPDSAQVIQLFTHPLYRARGLATTEIATCMNRLVKLGVSTLSIWINENNDVVRRLLGKLDFREDQRLVQMVMRII